MQDLSDKELDQFFVDSEMDHNIKFEESSWLKLESKLQERSKKRIAKIRLALALVLFLGGALFLSNNIPWNIKEIRISQEYKRKANKLVVDDQNLLNNVTLDTTFKTRREPPLSFVKNEDEDILNILKNQEQINRNNSRLLEIKVLLAGKKILFNQKDNKNYDCLQKGKKHKGEIILLTAKNPLGERSDYNGSDSSHIKVNVNNIAQNREAAFQKVSEGEDQEKANSEDRNLSERENSTYVENGIHLIQKASRIDSINSDLIMTLENKDSSSLLTKVNKRKSLPGDAGETLRRKLSLGLLVTPDISSVGFFKPTTPGIALGVIGEYHLTDRWTIQTGLIRSSKTYSSQHGFNSTEGYWAYKNNADRIDGSCKVFDIPLNIKYHFFTGPQSRIFVSTGLSSYFMYNEKYSFVYKSTGSTRSWDSNEKNNYYFSVSNFSLGYERYVSKSFSIQTEPFIKIPIKNVGDGKTKLITIGLFFSLKYTLYK